MTLDMTTLSTDFVLRHSDLGHLDHAWAALDDNSRECIENHQTFWRMNALLFDPDGEKLLMVELSRICASFLTPISGFSLGVPTLKNLIRVSDEVAKEKLNLRLPSRDDDPLAAAAFLPFHHELGVKGHRRQPLRSICYNRVEKLTEEQLTTLKLAENYAWISKDKFFSLALGGELFLPAEQVKIILFAYGRVLGHPSFT